MTQTDFDSLVRDIQVAYDSSDIKQYADKHGYCWCWDICTRIVPRSALILGFNPGAAADIHYDPQLIPCNEGFLDACNKHNGQDVGSLVRIRSYLEKYPNRFPQSVMGQMGQANYCFFRSKNAGQISDDDIRRCHPIFQRFLTMAEPSMILCFSTRARHFLEKSVESLDESPPFSFPKGRSTVVYRSAKGVVLLENKKVPAYFLPHPNYRISKDVREQAWAFCFGAHLLAASERGPSEGARSGSKESSSCPCATPSEAARSASKGD